MALPKELKAKVRTYFETHNDSVRDVARMHKVNEQTLHSWIKNEKWEKNSRGVDVSKVEDDLLNDAVSSKLDTAKMAIANQLKRNFNSSGVMFDELEIKLATEEVLLKASSLRFLQATQLEAGLVAKREMENTLYKAELGDKNAQNKVLYHAEKVVSIFGELQRNIHGKDTPNVAININNASGGISSESIGELSDDELMQIALGDDKNG